MHGGDIALESGVLQPMVKAAITMASTLIKYFEHSNDQNAALKAMGGGIKSMESVSQNTTRLST